MQLTNESKRSGKDNENTYVDYSRGNTEHEDIMVSVAVITYNMDRYLPTLLLSILKQKVNFRYEIVINDDCSPDSSRKIIMEYADRYPGIIKTAFLPKNVRGSRNMYHVLSHCEGKYIAILEGDDFWEDEYKLQYQADFLENHPEYIGMTCNSWCEHGEEITMKDVMRKRKEPKVFTIADFMNRHFHDRLPSSTDTWMFHNIFRPSTGDYSVFYEAHDMVWDQSLILILYGRGKIYADPKIVSHHRSVTKPDGTNYQSLIMQKNFLHSDSKMYQRLEVYMEKDLNINCAQFKLVRGDVWIDAVFRALKTHNKEDRRTARLIWKEQGNKKMLMGLFAEKSIDIIKRKALIKVSLGRG